MFPTDLSVVCAYILGRVNAYRDLADLAAWMDMRSCNEAARSLDAASIDPLKGRTFRDEHQPGAKRHILNREYRLDNGPGERGYTGPKDGLSAFPGLISRRF